MRRFIVPALLAAAIAACVAAIVIWRQPPGVRVTVINSGPELLSEVVVHVTGNEHRIGSLAAGESCTVRVAPTSESHVELAFVDGPGRAHRLNAGGYFEPAGYRGTFEIELENGTIKRKEDRVGLSFF